MYLIYETNFQRDPAVVTTCKMNDNGISLKISSIYQIYGTNFQRDPAVVTTCKMNDEISLEISSIYLIL